MKGVKDTHGNKNKKTVIGLLALGLSLVLACAVTLALYPTGSGARYVDSEVYEGEEIYVGEDADHGNHEGWVNLNSTYPSGDTEHGVTWTTSTTGTVSCTIIGTKQEDDSYKLGASYYGKYYLSDDLEANLTIGSETDWDKINVDLCLNGHALTGSQPLTIKYTGTNKQRCNKTTVNLYDCGGGKGVHYYKLRADGVSYDFSDDGINPDDPDTYDGYVRGGLITGGNVDSIGIGGGVTLEPWIDNDGSATLNMYGGTIAGNHSSYGGGGIFVHSGEVNMYGGSVEGNQSLGGVVYAGVYNYGGAGVCVLAPSSSTDHPGPASFTMYGGTIRNNYSGVHGGGVEVYSEGTIYSAVFEMYGGTIEGNRAQYGGGVGMYCYNNPTSGAHADDAFYMHGGTIRDNTSVYGGGGIYMYSSSSEIKISGGTITGNVQEEIESGVSNRGGGIDFFNEDTITLSGTAYVYGNYCAGERCNIGISEGHLLTLGELEDGAKIGVTLIDGQEGITEALDTPDEETLSACLGYIVSDDTTYKVAVNGEGTQLVLQKKKES